MSNLKRVCWRWRRWAYRMLVLFGATSVVFVAGMSIAIVDPAAGQHLPAKTDVIEASWPKRLPTQELNVIRSGELPDDMGAYGQCRVMSLGTDKTDATAENFLLVASGASDKDNTITGTYKSNLVGATPSSRFEIPLDGKNLLFATVLPTRQKQKGVLFYLWSIDSQSSGERSALQLARERGWNVVACTMGIDFLVSDKVTIDDHGATRLAKRIDNHLSDRAYALEAIIHYLEEQQPGLLVGPRVIVGTSAGAIALPTAVSRIGPVDAAVLIGGGENVARVMTGSSLFSGHVELVETLEDRTDPRHLKLSSVVCSDPDKRNDFVDRVLRRSKLDPHHTAAALRGTPVLMLHAQYDRIVHAETGQSLYESLGRPARWTYRTGHLGLATLVPWKIGYILDWIEEAVGK